MASVVDICNLAIANLGGDAVVSAVSPPDGSIEAMHCARFYPVARKAALELHEWSFATHRKALTEVSTTELPDGWVYAYGLPNKSLRVTRVVTPLTEEGESEPFKQEALDDGTGVIFTNAEDASAIFIYDEENPVKFSGLFVIAIARLLSSFLAGPLIKGKTGSQTAQEQYKLYLTELTIAREKDSSGNQTHKYKEFTPGGIEARA